MYFTRVDYTAHRCSFYQYFSQFLRDDIRKAVEEKFGKRIRKSSRNLFLDIPDEDWESLALELDVSGKLAFLFAEAKDHISTMGAVCVLKAAAIEIRGY